MSIRPFLVSALLVTIVAVLPTADAAPACTPYQNVAGTKQRTCVDPDGGTRCPAYTEGWRPPPFQGYFRTCYGTALVPR